MPVPKVNGKERRRKTTGEWRRKRSDTGCHHGCPYNKSILDRFFELVGL